MESNEPEAQADKEPGTENQKQQPPARWKEVISGAWHDFSPGYMPNLVVSLIFLLIAPAIGAFMNKPKIIIGSFALGLTVLIWVLAIYLMRHAGQSAPAEQPAEQADAAASKFSSSGQFFIVRPQMTLTAPNSDGPFLFLYATEKGQAIAPLGLLISVEITNNRPTATRLQSYVADLETGPSEWTRIYNIPQVADDSIYFANDHDITRCWRVTFNPGMFDLRATRQTLQPGEPVEGWMIFEFPPLPQVTPAAKVRLRLENSQGEVEEAIFSMFTKNDEPGQRNLGGGSFSRIGDAPEINFGSVPLRPFYQR